MRRSNLKKRMKNGERVIGTMVQEVRTPAIAQILKQVGFDFFMLDMEHGAFNLETAAEIIRVARLVDIAPLVRVCGPQYELIARVLDQGAAGVMVPRIETRSDVEVLVLTGTGDYLRAVIAARVGCGPSRCEPHGDGWRGVSACTPEPNRRQVAGT